MSTIERAVRELCKFDGNLEASLRQGPMWVDELGKLVKHKPVTIADDHAPERGS